MVDSRVDLRMLHALSCKPGLSSSSVKAAEEKGKEESGRRTPNSVSMADGSHCTAQHRHTFVHACQAAQHRHTFVHARQTKQRTAQAYLCPLVKAYRKLLISVPPHGLPQPKQQLVV